MPWLVHEITIKQDITLTNLWHPVGVSVQLLSRRRSLRPLKQKSSFQIARAMENGSDGTDVKNDSVDDESPAKKMKVNEK